MQTDGRVSTRPSRRLTVSSSRFVSTKSRLLPITPRLQWKNGHGYCGETSLQSIGLYYGAWISQDLIRKVAKGELLLGVNEQKALDALHFDRVTWNSDQKTPQFHKFSLWMKKNLLEGTPTVFTAFIKDGDNDPDYDHIMTAVGVRSKTPKSYDPTDVLVFNTNLGETQLERTFKSFSDRRKSTDIPVARKGGAIPAEVDYGVAVKGITDKKHATVPVRLTVPNSSEPNVSLGESPIRMNATVTASELKPGHRYALLRYDSYKDVPTHATAREFLKSKHSQRTDFTASGEQWTFSDPKPFWSDGAVYYRCVPL